ncbi:MAG: DJ-1/PfpI family protein [Spirochaetia bacterium]|jgi:4-methyl-5(b-hydroxyethyl)-thiazole monophosphate biosynthesis|nr:DJ-1/PfpI family protein [Spirochaetia bacterium]
MKKACVILANGCEEVEAITPIDYLRRAGIDVVVAGLGSREILGSHDIAITTDAVLDDIDSQDFDCIVVPGGGGGSKAIAEDTVAVSFIKRQAATGRLIAAICAAPALVLGEACGLLKKRRFTCYPGMESHVDEGLFEETRVVDDGDIITARAAGCAGEFSLAIVRALCGGSKAKELEASVLL